MSDYTILAFYCFTEIADPAAEVARFKAFLERRDVKCRIYIATEGINAQMSAKAEDAEAFLAWFESDSKYKGYNLKREPYHEHVLPHQTVKVRRQLVALDKPIDVSKACTHVSPQQWKKMLEERDENTILVDVRNDYETQVGTFEGAICPPIRNFRDFPEYLRNLESERDPKKTKVMMCCTGGIRCELFSVVMAEKGYKEIVQLEGGIINYGQQVGDDHWKGRLFVFDDRLAVPISPKKTNPEAITTCIHCHKPSDVFYNCAHMSCNELFIGCRACAEKYKGCCSSACSMCGERVRKFDASERPKPFRRINKGLASCSLV